MLLTPINLNPGSRESLQMLEKLLEKAPELN
jgi:hypothetical protein